jgi:signal peptidase
MAWRFIQRALTITAVAAMVLLCAGLLYSHSGKTALLSVQSGSMAPLLHKGDLVAVNRIPARQLAVGDVITYINPGHKRQTITHRIIALPTMQNGGRFVTRGDANALPDTPIPASAVVGKVQRHVPYVGYVSDIVHRPAGLLLCIYTPALMVVAEEFKRLLAYYKTQGIYRLAGRGYRRGKRAGSLAWGAPALAICLVAGLAIMPPARAALSTTATLTGSTISGHRAVPHIMIRELAFECSLDNTGTANRLPGILFYNPTTADINTGGWYVQSSGGRLVTFPAKTVFDAKDNYDIEPDLRGGINYAGDYLALFDASGHVVDAISWGTDTTYLNPALVGGQAGTALRRVSLTLDTDRAVDWAVSVGECIAVRRE